MAEKKKAGARAAGISDSAVRAKTGKGWDEWFQALDAAGANKLDHTSIARLLREKHGVSSWWNQMVAVGYEQARGLRRKNERPDGYSLSASRTLDAPLAAVFGAWNDPRRRAKWIDADGMVMRKATSGKSMRITWGDGTNVDVYFYDKGAGRSQVSVQHSKLKDARSVARLKTDWGRKLDRLRSMLESKVK